MRRLLSSLLLGVLLAVACRPGVSNTGYEGTWSRGNDRVTSTVSIYRQGEAYLFRWTLRSRGGGREVKCGWDGHCKEFVDGEKAADYFFKTWIDPETELLMVECDVKVSKPIDREFHYVDELVLDPQGLVLTSYTIERDGQKFEGGSRPKRSFNKVADRVASPPVRGTS